MGLRNGLLRGSFFYQWQIIAGRESGLTCKEAIFTTRPGLVF
jgi:hypothetical protein